MTYGQIALWLVSLKFSGFHGAIVHVGGGTVGVKKTTPFPFPFHSIPFRFTGNERAEKMACRFARFARSVPPVLPVLHSNPSACARSNESCLSGDPAYRRVCTRGCQYPPSLAPSLARPELNGRKWTERNG